MPGSERQRRARNANNHAAATLGSPFRKMHRFTQLPIGGRLRAAGRLIPAGEGGHSRIPGRNSFDAPANRHRHTIRRSALRSHLICQEAWPDDPGRGRSAFCKGSVAIAGCLRYRRAGFPLRGRPVRWKARAAVVVQPAPFSPCGRRWIGARCAGTDDDVGRNEALGDLKHSGFHPNTRRLRRHLLPPGEGEASPTS